MWVGALLFMSKWKLMPNLLIRIQDDSKFFMCLRLFRIIVGLASIKKN